MILEILKETLMRRRAVRRLHLAYLGVYAVVYIALSAVSSSVDPPQWGMWLFAWSGCAFPVLLTVGLFGGDIASGRMMQLVTKPISLGTLYLFRVFGVYIQCVIHLSICYGSIFLVSAWTNTATAGNLGPWFVASLLIAPAWMTLSATVSTFVSRDFNVAVVFIGAIATFMVLQSADVVGAIMGFPAMSKAVETIGIYAVPSVVLLCRLAMRPCAATEGFVAVIHPMVMTVLYAAIGIGILNQREFMRERE
ncbi:hypothetical protein [Anaerobaca lacustris]|uniref:ABC transporter permease n=1 Tax=Anaerobaca lacustris TaxID=3044600 RepID=A0AAW6TYR8_9BACT|nr:hypothetical protein [Sedimentisphaerales bacterium M17dextr]